ncbi:MAG: hypothetical protein PHE43_01915 [Candidatus Nanoarchaeia archaeon]|nr:hypothetical protein [Candidatus Nanoarchaeia archaeon]
MFKEILFWCEFPKKTNWDLINKEIDFKTEIYIASNSKEEFLKYKNKIKNKNIKIGVWPVLPKSKGYWFSGFVDKESIDRLDQFKDFNIKIDLEPPIINGKGSFFTIFKYLSKYLFRKGINNKYLADKINSLSNKKIILGPISPKFYMKKYIEKIKWMDNYYQNYLFYTPMVIGLIRPIFRMWYWSWLRLKKLDNFCIAVGPVGKGIFGEEPEYKKLKQLERDIYFVEKMGATNLAIFELSGLFNKKDYKDWLNLIKRYKK